MDGKIFNTQVDPQSISKFVFDLQRFELTDAQSDDSVFSCIIGNETKYGKAEDFKTDTIGAATKITLLKSFTAPATAVSDTTTTAPTPALKLSNDCELDLAGNTLTINSEIGIFVANEKSLSLKDDTGNGLIDHTWNPGDTVKKAKDARNYATIQLGKVNVAYNATNKFSDDYFTNSPKDSNDKIIEFVDGSSYEQTNAKFTMSGGKIQSKTTSIVSGDKSTITITGGTIESSESCGVYYGDRGNGGSMLNMSGGTLKTTGALPPIQVGGMIGTQFPSGAVETALNISGGNLVYAPSDGITDLSQGNNVAIYNAGNGNVTVSNNAKIVSSKVGIEVRAGKLNVTGGTIASNATLNENGTISYLTDGTGIKYHKTSEGSSFDDGVAVVVSQHRTGKAIDVKISGGEISGYTALAVANPEGKTDSDGATTVEVTGGTLKSTSTATQDSASYSATGYTDASSKTQPLYTLQGRNAIFNGDSRVKIKLSGATVDGSIASTVTNDNYGYEIGTTNDFSNFTYPSSGGFLTYSQVSGSTDNFKVNILGVGGWNKTIAQTPTWEYTYSNGTTTTKDAASLTGSDSTLTLTNTNTDTPIVLDTTAYMFKNLAYKTIDASEAAATVQITANDNIETITGGTGNDTFVLNSGSVTVTNYATGDKIQFASAESTDEVKVTKEDDNAVVTCGETSFTLENAAELIGENGTGLSYILGSSGTETTYTPLVQIGNNVYTSFDEALANVQDGDTIKLLKTVSVTNSISVASGKTWTLDLNGKTLTGSVNVSGNLTVSDTAGGGSISTTDDAITVLSGGTFNMTGGTVTSSDGSAVVNNGTVNIRGGSLRAENGRGVSNSTVNSYLNMWSGLVFGKVGIKMLAGFLSLLGGRVHGKGTQKTTNNVTDNVVDNADAVENNATTETGTGGIGIDVASNSGAEVTVGDKDNKSEIEVSGDSSGLSVSGSGASTLNLYDGTYSSGNNGSSISYDSTNTNSKLTVDGAILENKFEVKENANATVGKNIVISSVAVSSTAKQAMNENSETTSTKAIAELLKTDDSLNGQSYSFVGSTSNFFLVKVIPASTEQHNVLENVVEYDQEAEIGGTNYGSFKDAAAAASVNATIKLLDNISFGTEVPISLSGSGTVNLDFNGYNLTYNGDGNAAISLGSNVGLNLTNTGDLLDGGIEFTGNDVAASVNGSKFGLKLADGSKNVYFYNINSAMYKLDGSETLAYTENATPEGNVLSYTREANKIFRLEGITEAKGVSITATDSNYNISLTAANFKDATVANGGNYKFNLVTATGGGASSFTGSGGDDTITNAIANLTINGGAGNDSIVNSGASAYIDGGEGNDKITNTATGASLFGGAGNDNLSAGDSGAYLDGGAGNDSLNGGEGNDTLVFSGGADSIEGYNANDTVSLSGFSPIINGLNLASTDGGLKLTFDDDNTLEFKNATAASITSGSNTYVYTQTAISLTSVSDSGVTLGKDYADSSFSAGTVFTTINAAAVSLDGTFNVTGKTDGGNYIVGSNYVATSIYGGSSADTLKLGTAGGTLNGGTSGADVLIGSAVDDTIIANGAAKINAGLGSNKISLGSASNASIDVSNGNDTISLGNDANISISVFGFDSTDAIYFASSISSSNIGFSSESDKPFTVKTGESSTVSIGGFTNDTGSIDLWTFDKNNVASYVSRQITGGAYSLESDNKTLKFKGKVTDTATDIKLGGLQTTDGIVVSSLSASDKGVSLTADNFGADGVSVMSASSYKFSLTSGDYNNKFFGSSGKDSIYNAGSALLIDGGADNDYIENVGGENATLNGGAGNDTLVGSSAAETFVYTAGNDSIGGYSAGDIITTTLTPITDVSKVSSVSGSLTFNFGSNNTLTVDSTVPVSVKSSDGDTYIYTDKTIAKNTESVTLTSKITRAEGYDGSATAFSTIDATAVTVATSINGNGNANYMIGSATAKVSLLGNAGGDSLYAGKAGTYLDGGSDNDLLVGAAGNDTFIYNGGNDTIQSYTDGSDTVSLSSNFTLPTTFKTEKYPQLSYNNSNYVLQFDENNSLTFQAKSAFSVIQNNGTSDDTYSYTAKTITKNEEAITLGPSYTSKYNGANTNYTTINAAEVTKAIRITGNSNANYIVGGTAGGTLVGGDGADSLVAGTVGTFLNGGDGDDSLVGGAGNDTFAYTGGNDRIQNYLDGDLVSVAGGINVAGATVASINGTGETKDLVIGFDDNTSLTFEEGATSTISLKSGRNYYTFKQDRIALDNSITLTAGYTASSFEGGSTYDTIDASAVSLASGGISITGNDNGNYIAIGKSGGSLFGGKGDDTLVGGTGADIFRYTAGKDVIQNFGTGDSLTIDDTAIAKARASSRRLTFTMTDKNNTLVFRSDDSIPAQISLDGGGYLTKDGVVKDNELKLFSSAKGRIDLREDTVYSAADITSISAENVKSQSVTLVGGTDGGSFTFAGTNKKRDGFEYNGGAVSIGDYESGKDRINLGDYSITGFTADDTKVAISLNGTDNAISLLGAKGDEILIHQSTNRGNSYSKMVFADNGVVYDKAASKATNATIWSGIATGSGYSAEGKIRKITVKDSLVSGISLGAGNNNTVIDASAAGAVSLISGAKNDRFIGSSNTDMFVYSAGKDIIQDFNIGGATDQISLNGNGLELDDAKISAGKKSIRFKFAGSSKNVLTVKPTKGDTLSGELKINGKDRTYGKNSIAESGSVSLTSKFGGTYKIDGVSTVDGRLVEKKLTFKVTTAKTNETLYGGKNKTTFKGGGGTDSLVGGSGDDIFFYARGDEGTATIADFDFSNDKLKIAGGTLAKVSTIDGGVRFGMKNGKGESPEVGWFDIITSATYDDDDKSTLQVDGSQVLIKTNNTYYWFAAQDVTEEVTTEGGNGSTVTLAKAGELITWDKKVSSSDVKNHDSAVIELNYGTNLVRAGVAVAVSKDNDKATLPSA